MTGGQDRRGQRRSEFQADQPAAPPTPPQAREAPQAPAAVEAPQPRYRPQFRGDGGQGLANRQGDNARDRGGDRRSEGDRRGDGARPDWNRPDESRGGRRWDGDRNGGDRRDWDRRDDRGRPHWQQGRYPQIYRSPQRYRYGYYSPPIGFYSHNWAFGEFLPRGWYGSDYMLDDWWDYDLPYPPPGYDWIRVGNDALLIDRYSGRVVQVVRYLFW
jgi:Ni/Co efflux regulator RcnB